MSFGPTELQERQIIEGYRARRRFDGVFEIKDTGGVTDVVGLDVHWPRAGFDPGVVAMRQLGDKFAVRTWEAFLKCLPRAFAAAKLETLSGGPYDFNDSQQTFDSLHWSLLRSYVPGAPTLLYGAPDMVHGALNRSAFRGLSPLQALRDAFGPIFPVVSELADPEEVIVLPCPANRLWVEADSTIDVPEVVASVDSPDDLRVQCKLGVGFGGLQGVIIRR